MKIILIACVILLQSFNTYASRGWYVSIGGVSAQQSHDISNYSYTHNVSVTPQYSVTGTPQFAPNAVYWFSSDANNIDISNPFNPNASNFSNLKNAINNQYIINSTAFKLNTNGTNVPSFAVVNSGNPASVGNNASPTTGATITNGVATYTPLGGTNQTIATIDRYDTSNPSFYKITLNPISRPTEFYKNTILQEVSTSNTSINTQQQMQDFTSLFNAQTSRTAEVSFGYKFRPFRSPFFISPQIDLTYYKNNTGTNTAYMDKATQVISLTPSTNSQEMSYSSLDLSYTASLVFKLGFEQRFWLFGMKIPFSLYALLGSASSFRNINTIRDNAFGLKYGFGGEVFLSERIALFAEFYQIQYVTQNYIFENTRKYTGNAFSTDNISLNITNGGTKTLTVNYPSDKQSLTAQVTSSEKYNLQSRISAFKFGLTYYFQ
jgi:hypothetical protein